VPPIYEPEVAARGVAQAGMLVRDGDSPLYSPQISDATLNRRLADVDAATGQGSVIGVIGGYQQGGDTPQVSYAAIFSAAVTQLYATAEAGG